MKRLAMAATFALALSLGGWSPAAAQADVSSQAELQDVRSAGEAGSETDSPGHSDAGPENVDETEAATDPDEGGTTTDPAGSSNPDGSNDATAPGGGQDDSDAGDGTEEPTEESVPIEASLSPDKTTMTVDEAAEGVPYTVTGLKAGDTVTASPGDDGPITVDSDGPFHGTLHGNTELKAGDVLTIKVTVARDGQGEKTLTGSVTITAAEEDPELSVDPKTQELDTFLDNGVDITMANCAPDEEIAFTVTREGDDATIWEDTQTGGEDGTGSATFVPGTGGEDWIGDFVVNATCGDETADTTFSVTESGAEVDVELSVTPQAQQLSDFLDHGVTITLVNCHVDSEVTFRVSSKRDPGTTIWEETQTAGEDAAGSATFVPGTGGEDWIGDFLVSASCGDESAQTTFTVTEDDFTVDPKLSIDPERIPGVDFVNRDKGVELTVTDCAPDADVTFEVFSADGDAKLYEQTAAANADGTAGIQVYGLSNDPAAYVGTYTVMATCMDVSREGQFVVTGGQSGGGDGGDADEAGDSGNDVSMPRTGAELTGLGAGAVLILGGAAAIIFARRRNQI